MASASTFRTGGSTASPSYLYLKRKIYYFRVVFNKELQQNFHRTELRISLQTPYLRAAAFRAQTLNSRFRLLLESAVPLSYNEIKSRLSGLLKALVENRTGHLEPLRVEIGPEPGGTLTTDTVLALGAHLFKSEQAQKALMLAMPKADGHPSAQDGPLTTAMEFFLRLAELNKNVLIEQGFFSEAEFIENQALIGKCLLQMEHKANQIAQADENGDFNASLQVMDISPRRTEPEAINPAPGSISFSEALARYEEIKVKDGSWKATSRVDSLNRLSFFSKILGDRGIDSYTRDEVRQFRDTLGKMPPNHSKSKAYAGKSIQEILEMRPQKTLSVATINLIMDAVGSFFEWCVQENLLKVNPAKRLQIKDSRQAVELRDAFTTDEIRRIFTAPEFSKLKSKNEAYFWIPLIGLYTGMRLEEISQLHCSDIYEIEGEGIWVLNINDLGQDEEGFGKSVKNVNAVRIVPVHPELLKLGLIEYLSDVRQKGKVRLFWQLKRTADTVKFGKQPGKQFKVLITKVLGANTKLSFHSLRHTFADFYKQRGLQSDVFRQVYGHNIPELAARQYGSKFPPRLCYEKIISALDFGIDHESAGTAKAR